MLIVDDCPKGSVVEIIDRRYGQDVASGRFYRLGDSYSLTRLGYLQRNAWQYFTGEPVGIAAGLRCRIVESV